AAQSLHAQVVGVLAEVDELDDRRAGDDRAAREREEELLRRHLDARRIDGRRSRRREQERRDRSRGECGPHLRIAGRWKGWTPGSSGFASVWNHCSRIAACTALKSIVGRRLPAPSRPPLTPGN